MRVRFGTSSETELSPDISPHVYRKDEAVKLADVESILQRTSFWQSELQQLVSVRLKQNRTFVVRPKGKS